MEKSQIKKTNKRFARFLGWEFKPEFRGYDKLIKNNRSMYLFEWQPHKDLNQLLQVVEKIQENGLYLRTKTLNSDWRVTINFMNGDARNFMGGSFIDCLYGACIAALDHIESEQKK